MQLIDAGVPIIRGLKAQHNVGLVQGLLLNAGMAHESWGLPLRGLALLQVTELLFGFLCQFLMIDISCRTHHDA